MAFNPATLRVAPILLLVALHLVVLALLFGMPEGVWPVTLIGGRLRVASGLVYGEIAVIAAWAAWSQMTLALRVPLALVGSLLAGFVLLTAMDNPRGSQELPLEQTVMTLTSALLHSVLILGMCLAARAFGIDWRRVASNEVPARRQAQFHLWELLALMAAIAVLLGALRALWPKDASFDWANVREGFVMLSSVLLIGNLLLANTVVTIYWTPRGPLKNLAITLGIAAVITVLEWLAARSLDLRRTIFMFAWMNGTYLGWLLMSLGLMRLTGYRLERVRFPKWSRLKSSAGTS